MTAYREGCGTHRGLLLHQAAGESPCPECLRGEAVRRVEHEGIPVRPSPVPDLPPVSPEQAARNRDVLERAVKPVRGRSGSPA